VLRLPVGGERVEISQRERPGAPALLYFGGNAEDVALAVAEFARAFPSLSVHGMHYPGYGGSTGRPVESLIVREALAVFDHLHERHDRIVVVGRSLGSGVAVQVAARRPAHRLVLVTPFAGIRAIAQAQFPFLPMRLLLRSPFESAQHAREVQTPTLLIIGDRDEIIPRASSDALLAAFPPGVARAVILSGDHNALGVEGAYLQAVRDGLGDTVD
jgi:pimeloyl-ACP methyl ester carboxylesterase